ncbi:XkdQ/YqbQ family protein [Paenibacillus sp. 481]|uniref:XkdQ/YqbQ family protein n=1 Tax=Paenibacillus sp. 481 TaxID=2835869 RepID=UPI001E2A418C|nr:hypothetical protein [Paenibacillus sp. 481]UHA72300.1 hypothetical protein KIK04_16640 [Paenibacillus sp. 481]
MLSVLIDNRNGTMWDISELVTDMSWSTSRITKPSTFELTYVKGALFQSSDFQVNNGDVIKVQWQGMNVFYGYVFSIDTGTGNDVKLTAYDQLRYLQANDTYVFKNTNATAVIKRIASDFSLRVGTLVETKHNIPSLIQDDKKLLDIVCRVLDLTLIGTKEMYVLYDDFGSLSLKKVSDWRSDRIVGRGSQMTGLSYTRTIDDETYNRVKLIRDNEETGKREVYIMQDSANIAKWGRLQLYKKLDEQLNKAQIEEQLKTLMKLHNREKRTLKIDALGDVRIRAGMLIPIYAPEQDVKQYMLVDECSHSWSGSEHTMSLTLKVI